MEKKSIDENETVSRDKSDELNKKNEILRIVKREVEKLKIGGKENEKENSDSLANQVKETLKLEIISKDSNI